MAEFNKYAPCGFCRFFGQEHRSENVCENCEIQLIRVGLDELLEKIQFDHDHRYRRDDEDWVRNCAHCEHGLTYETRYSVDADDGEVWCALKTPDGSGLSTNKGSDTCDNWLRATGKSVGGDKNEVY